MSTASTPSRTIPIRPADPIGVRRVDWGFAKKNIVRMSVTSEPRCHAPVSLEGEPIVADPFVRRMARAAEASPVPSSPDVSHVSATPSQRGAPSPPPGTPPPPPPPAGHPPQPPPVRHLPLDLRRSLSRGGILCRRHQHNHLFSEPTLRRVARRTYLSTCSRTKIPHKRACVI